MKNEEHVLLLLVGRTGSGKSALIKTLCERTGMKQLVSQTTRPRRNDQDSDHVFVDVADYQRAKENDEIAAYTEIAGNHYYATKEQLYDADLYTVDPIGRDRLLSLDLPNIRFVTIYISCPDDIREYRAIEKRGDNKHTYRVREFSERQQFRKFVSDEQWDYSVKNIDFAKAYSTLRWIATIEGAYIQHEKREK
jgi:guanylate kinase